MIHFDNVIAENTKTNNLNWLYIPYHPFRILITRGSGSGKTNTLLNLIKFTVDGEYDIIDKIHLYVKDLNEEKYQYFILQNVEKAVLNIVKIQKAL